MRYSLCLRLSARLAVSGTNTSASVLRLASFLPALDMPASKSVDLLITLLIYRSFGFLSCLDVFGSAVRLAKAIVCLTTSPRHAIQPMKPCLAFAMALALAARHKAIAANSTRMPKFANLAALCFPAVSTTDLMGA
jgi:hypothetical protein